jgi:hypothetical protein
MIGALMSPLRGAVRTVAALPSAVEAILVLPTLLRQLEEVRADTAALHEILVALQGVQNDTSALPVIQAELEQLSGIVVPLGGAAARFGRIADRLPQRRRAAAAANANGNGNGAVVAAETYLAGADGNGNGAAPA